MGMKRANGTGCVTKLSGNRRNPWYAKITLVRSDFEPKETVILSDSTGRKYFPTRTIPDELLVNWNKEKGNIDIDKTNYTFQQVYEEYSKKYFPTDEEIILEKETHQKTKGKLGRSISSNLKGAYKKCSSLYNRLYKSLRKDDYMNIILNTTGCGTTINSLANLFKKLDNYAISQDIILKGYANLIKITDDMYLPVQKEGMPYSYEEIDTIWNYEKNIIAQIVLATIYEGTRIEEILFTKIADVHIEDGYFIAGLKTSAGKRRIIPIHNDMLPIFKRNYYKNINNEFLFTINKKKIDYNKQFLTQYTEFMNKLGMSHTSHDGRKTLHTELDRLGANQVCVDKIFGHKSGNIGNDVYTKKSIEELKSTINLVNYRNNIGTKFTYFRASGNGA